MGLKSIINQINAKRCNAGSGASEATADVVHHQSVITSNVDTQDIYEPPITFSAQTTNLHDLVLVSEPDIGVLIYKDSRDQFYINYGDGNGPSVCINDDLKRVSGRGAEVDIYLEKNGLLFLDYRDGEGLKICNADRYYELLETQPVVTSEGNSRDGKVDNIQTGYPITIEELELIRGIIKDGTSIAETDIECLLSKAKVLKGRLEYNQAGVSPESIEAAFIYDYVEVLEEFIHNAEFALEHKTQEA